MLKKIETTAGSGAFAGTRGQDKKIRQSRIKYGMTGRVGDAASGIGSYLVSCISYLGG